MFIDPQGTVSITEGEDTIWVKERMDFITRSKWMDELLQIIPPNTGGGRKKRGKVRRKVAQDTDPTDELQGLSRVQLGAANMALLKLNIVRWEGPSFTDRSGRPIPCTPDKIEQLDPAQPLIKRVVEVLSELNEEAEQLPGEEEGEEADSPLASG